MRAVKTKLCLVVLPLVVCGALLAAPSSVLAQGGVTAESVPSNANPSPGAQITVDINIDVTGTTPAELLGSFTGTLNWDPAVLDYVSHDGPKGGFAGVVGLADTSTGKISFNGANATGASGKSTVLTITFDVIGANGSSTLLDLEFTAMSAALTFTDLLQILTITYGQVTVGTTAQLSVVASVDCPINPAPGSNITIPVSVDMTAAPPPDDKLGSFTASLTWDPAVLQYVSNSGLKSGFAGAVNTTNATSGTLGFTGANATGAAGTVAIFEVTFSVIGAAGSSSKMDLEFTAMAAAGSFRDLIPFLTTNDCTVSVGGECDPNDCTGPALFPVPENGTVVGELITGMPGKRICIDIRVRDNPQPISSFAFVVKVDPNHLAYVEASPGDLTSGFVQVNGSEVPSGSGAINCGGFGLTPIPTNSAGSLIRLCFDVICSAGDTSTITISNLRDDVTDLNACCNRFACSTCKQDGDVNGDGDLTPADALCAFRIFLSGGSLPSDCDVPGFECELIAADPNCSGEVTPSDALAIFSRFLQGQPPAECFAQPLGTTFKPQAGPRQLTLSQQRSANNADILKVSFAVDDPSAVRAFGLRLSYPADKLHFKGVERTALTAQWTDLDGRENTAGTITIGGYAAEAFDSESTGAMFRVVFESKGQSPALSEFEVSQLEDDFSNALIKGAGSQGPASVPKEFKLHQNFPNPFHAGQQGSLTVIRFDVPGSEKTKVELAVYNLAGQLVRHLVSDDRAPGQYEVSWDGRNDKGQKVPSGTYLYRLKAGTQTESRHMTIVR